MSSATATRPAYRLNMSPDAAAAGRARSAAIRSSRSAEYARKLGPIARELRQLGMPLREIAEHLTENGHRTPRGMRFTVSQVAQLLNRYEG